MSADEYQVGLAHRAAGEVGQAIVHFQRVLERQPTHADARNALLEALAAAGCAESERQHPVAAMEYFEEILRLAPDWHEIQHNLGHLKFLMGDVDDAMALFRRAATGPQSAFPRSMLACIIPGSAASDNQAILDARRAFAERDLPPARTVVRARGDRLRVGYVSSFFHRENWMKPVWGLINHHDRERFDVLLYSDGPIGPGYRAHPRDAYFDMSAHPNEAVADRIEQDGVDILVDLNGYSALRRLPLAALKPAPVLVGWFNIFATTGLAAYDCLVGDAEVIPPDEERFYSERIVRVPGSYLTFEVGYPVPDVVPPPCRAGGPITFGCLAPQYKITPDVIAAWCRILQGAPESSLVLRSTALAREDERRFVRERFGASAARVRLEGPASHYDFLRTYDTIDVALDTFPYNGGTTTTEAIWQGVPVLTFSGDRWVARTSASILRAGGLGQLVAQNVDDYVAMAVRMARAPETPAVLTDMRRTMRERLARSPVCDTPGFARHMEQVYRAIAT